jgi:hypothetical protein
MRRGTGAATASVSVTPVTVPGAPTDRHRYSRERTVRHFPSPRPRPTAARRSRATNGDMRCVSARWVPRPPSP